MERVDCGEFLGEGSYGKVYRNIFNPRQCIKVLPQPRGDRERAFLVNEIQTWTEVIHQNIVTLYDVKIVEEEVWIIMEACDTDLHELHKYVNFNPLDEAFLWFVLMEVSLALDELERLNVIHRDIKPENLMIQGGHIKVADFGLARFGSSRGETIAGTPGLIAPEVLDGTGHTVAADIYSLGATILQLSGIPQQHLCNAKMPELYNENLRELVHRMLSDCPDDRPPAIEIYSLVPRRQLGNKKISYRLSAFANAYASFRKTQLQHSIIKSKIERLQHDLIEVEQHMHRETQNVCAAALNLLPPTNR